MSELFLIIINMSISASWLVLAVLVLRFVLKKAPKWIDVLLWGIVAVRLICPLSIESALSLIPSAETISSEIMMSPAPVIHTGVPAINSVVNPIITESFAPEPMASANPLQIWVPILSVVWMIGMAILVVYTFVSYWRLRRSVGEAVILRENIYRSDRVDSPFVLGILRPKIYLPYYIDEENWEHVVAHERAHIRRKDHLWKPLGFLLLMVHWFNPLMWVAYILLCRDIELACDEKVIKEMGNEQRADYMQALVSCSVNRRMIAACPLAFGEVGVKARVKSVMNYKKPAFWVIVVSVIVCAVVAVCFLTNPAEEDAQGRMEEGYYLRIGAEGIEEIRISLPNSGGGVVNADGSFFQKGEEIYLAQLQNVTDLRGVSITALGKNGEVLYVLSVPEEATDAEIINLVGSDGWFLAPTVFAEIAVSGENIWSRRDTSDPVEMLAYLCQTELCGGSIREKPHISVPGNFGPHALFSAVPNDADALDVAMARRAFLLMRLYPEEVFYVTWSYPDEGGEHVRRGFFADEMSAILSLSSHSQDYEIPASTEDVDRLIQFLTIDETLFLRYAAEGNEFDPTRLAQKNAVWFTPEDIHDVEYMELVWHDGQRFTPLTGEGYDYIKTCLSSATEVGATACPYHSVLYIHRADGVVGKVLPAEDSCDVFQSGGKFYQFGDRANPPYYDSNETFYNHFGTSVNELPHYISPLEPTEPESVEPYAFTDILGCSGYVVSDANGPHNLRSYYAVAGNQRWLIAETFGFGEAEDYVVDLDGDGITELVANVTFGGDGARRAYVYQRRGDEIYLGTLSAEGLPNFHDWGVNSTWSEYEPSTGIFRLHYAQKNSDDYGVFEAKVLDRFRFDVFSPAPPVVTPLTDKELARFNETFQTIVYDKQGEPIGVNPVSGFFSSYYDDVRDLDFEEFMRYFPEDGSFSSDAEFEALKVVEAWPFDWVETRDDMPVPIHKYQARIVDMVLKEHAGITTADVDTSDVAYLPEYDAFYNYTSDFGPGMFTCTRGEMIGDVIRLYEELETGTDMLTLRKVGSNYQIVAHQCIEGNNAAEAVYG